MKKILAWLWRFQAFCEEMDPEYNPRTGAYAGQLLWQRKPDAKRK